MIVFPQTTAEVIGKPGEIRAGGTDIQERRHRGISSGPVVDLRDLPDRDSVQETPEGGLSLGSGLSIQALADHPLVRQGYPALARAAGGLATPQVRARGTLGGNLLQRVRCWYYRSPDFNCLKKGGAACLARGGDHLYHSCFDQGPCVAPHPSTLAVALLAQDATATVIDSSGKERVLSIPELLGDGSDPRRDHALPEGAYLASIELPAPVAGEQGACFRAIARERAEWPLVEVVARLRLSPAGTIEEARLVLGGVANRPLDAGAAAEALKGKAPTEESFLAAGEALAGHASPLPMTGYKVRLLPGAIAETLGRALKSAPARPFRPPTPSTPAEGATP